MDHMNCVTIVTQTTQEIIPLIKTVTGYAVLTNGVVIARHL